MLIITTIILVENTTDFFSIWNIVARLPMCILLRRDFCSSIECSSETNAAEREWLSGSPVVVIIFDVIAKLKK